MDKFTHNLYEHKNEHVLAKVISSRDVVQPKPPLHYEFRDSIVGSDDAILFGCLEPNTSIMLHLLCPDYKPNGWFRLTCPTHWGFRAAKVLYDMQLVTLKELVEQYSEPRTSVMSWIAEEKEEDILIYVDLEHTDVYAPWEELNGIGLLGQDLVNTQQGLLTQAAHHLVHATVQLQHISQFTENIQTWFIIGDIQAFIAKVIRLDIIPVG
ncbi:hypothetical protein EV421DRAFT_1737364 [Armillaria borealis]|uniref:Uncharacterized protein n=1 Tax=Armillaria borealis TaxID=47425 RepID=A0AA39JDC5_9AGAR|nr:hypothetical protein EV421DRAFT_1737364 [Armillaria borealis]